MELLNIYLERIRPFHSLRINRLSDVKMRNSRVKTTKTAERGNGFRHQIHCQNEAGESGPKVGQKTVNVERNGFFAPSS